MPDTRLRRDRRIVLTKEDIELAEKLKEPPVFDRLRIDRRADKNKRIGKVKR